MYAVNWLLEPVPKGNSRLDYVHSINKNCGWQRTRKLESLFTSPDMAKKKNKLGVENSLANNINARKKKGISRSKKKSTVDKKSYEDMKNNWGKDKNGKR